MTKAIILDLYDTLIYTSSKKRPYLNLLNSLGLTKQEITYWIDKALTENYQTLKDFRNEISKSNINIDKFEDQLEIEIETTHVFDDTFSFLENLSSKYELYLLSNLATPYKEPFYKLGLDKFIKEPFFSCDCGFKKPDFNFYNLIIKKTGLNPDELLMIGDNLKSDYEGAQNSGIKAILKNKPLSLILSEI